MCAIGVALSHYPTIELTIVKIPLLVESDYLSRICRIVWEGLATTVAGGPASERIVAHSETARSAGCGPVKKRRAIWIPGEKSSLARHRPGPEARKGDS